MSEVDGAFGAGDSGNGADSRSEIGRMGGRSLENSSSSPHSSGGYRYAAIEQAMDASASGA